MPGAFNYGMIPANSPKGTAFQSIQPAVLPAGVIQMFAGSTAPSGWLICDGSTVSRRIYSDLFKVIGTTYGAGDGNTTFTLPDMRGRVPMGAGTGAGLTARTLGTTYGTETHTLASGNIPQMTTGNMSTNASHTHGATKPIYVYDPNVSSAGLAGGNYVRGNDSAGINPVTSTSVEHTHTVGTASPTAVNHVPPSLGLNYIIKV